MHHVDGVHGDERLGDVGGERSHILCGEGAFLQARAQIGTVDQLHHQQAGGRLALRSQVRVEQRHQVRMVQPRKEGRLGSPPRVVRRGAGGEQFDRHGALELPVESAVDGCHAAPSQRLVEFVAIKYYLIHLASIRAPAKRIHPSGRGRESADSVLSIP